MSLHRVACQSIHAACSKFNKDLRKDFGVQVEELEIQHEEENRLKALKFESEVEILKSDIASAFEEFSDGKICAEDLLVRPFFHLQNTGVSLSVELSAQSAPTWQA